MITIYARGVNDAWRQAVEMMLHEGRLEDSRAGKVLVAPCPVMTVYDKPLERVLFDPIRDANPFFHIFEAMWMLAGRRDATFLNKFVRDFGLRFGEPDGNIHGAYGYRWRQHFRIDQLEAIANKLYNNPGDRQGVLQMWDAGSIADDLLGDWKDRPCNTHAYFRRRDDELDLTVLCRSNDILWGAYGANVVHFSFLLEYMAGRIGIKVGKLYQFSNNWHAYEATFKPYVEAAEDNDVELALELALVDKIYELPPVPMMENHISWDTDLQWFMGHLNEANQAAYNNPWFSNVLAPLVAAHDLYRKNNFLGATEAAEKCVATDWRVAARRWIERRRRKLSADKRETLS